MNKKSMYSSTEDILSFDVELKADERAANQLGARSWLEHHGFISPKPVEATQVSNFEEDLLYPEDFPGDLELTADEIKSQLHFRVALTKAVFGLYNNEPSCLIALRLSFNSRNTRLRFSSADVLLDFDDAAINSTEQAPEQRDETLSLSALSALNHARAALKPVITAHEPHRAAAPETQSTVQMGMHFGGPWPAPSMGLAVSKKVIGSAKITAMPKGRPKTMIRWTFVEDSEGETGVAAEATVALIVKHLQGRRFAMRLTVEATVKATTVVPLLREYKSVKEEIVFFTPDSLVQPLVSQRQSKDLVGGTILFGSSLYLPATTESAPILTVDALKELPDIIW
jgi:hypothetical protein